MIGVRRIGIAMSSFVIAIVLVCWVAMGRLGSPILLSFATSYFPSLTVGEISGGLSSSLIVKALKYQSNDIQLSIQKAEIDLRWQCVFKAAICINSLHTDGFALSLKETSNPRANNASDNEIITSPFPVSIDLLSASNSQVNLPNNIDISLNTLSSELRIFQQWQLLSPQLEGLVIQTPTEELFNNAVSNSQSQMTTTNVLLNDVFIPINAQITDLHLFNASLSQSGKQFILDALFFDARINAHQVNLNNLKAEHQAGTLEATATIQLIDEYPLSLNFQLHTELVDMPPLNVDAAVTGSLQNLQIQIQSHAPLISVTNAQLQPLSARLPLKLDMQWQGFTHHTLAPLYFPEITVDAGEMKVFGTIDDYTISLTTAVNTAKIPTPININLASLANTKRFEINSLIVQLLDGMIETTGQIKLSDSVNWQLSTRLTDINTQLIDQRLPMDINGQLDYQGQLSDGKPNINMKTIDILATQQGYPVSINGNGAYAANAGVLVSNLNITHKQNHIQGFARLLMGRRVDADIIVAIEALGESLPGYNGQVRGNLMVMGDYNVPDIEVVLDAAQITATNARGEPFSVADSASLRLRGTIEKQSMRLDYKRTDLDLVVQSNVEFRNSQWVASIEKANLTNASVTATLDQPAILTFDPNTYIVNTEKFCWQVNIQGKACIAQLNQSAGNTDFSLIIDNIAVDDWLTMYATPLHIASAEAMLSAQLQGSYSDAAGLIANAEGHITPANWQLGNSPQRLTVNLEPAHFSINANGHLIDSEFSLSGQSIGAVQVNSTFDTTPDERTIEASIIASQVSLAPLALLTEETHKLEGALNADININGDITKPKINGTLQLSQGLADIARAPAVLTDWNGSIVFDQFTADYRSRFNLGGGAGELNGTVNWREALTVNAELTGELLKLDYQDIQLSFSPDVSISYRQNQLFANGAIIVPQAKVEIQKLPNNAITPSRDVHLRGEPESSSLFDLADIDLNLSIDPQRLSQVQVDAFGLNASLTGQMRLTTQPMLMSFGDLQIVDGKYRAYGQELLIRTGEVQFNGPLSQPLLFVEAIRDPKQTEDNVVAGMLIDGIATQPNIRLFAEPSMDQRENLSYLLSGRGNIGNSEIDSDDFSGLLVGFGVSSSDRLTGSMGEALGIEDLQLAAKGSGKNTQVAVSGTIMPNLTLEYGVGVFESVSEVTLRYKLLDKLYVEAISSLDQSLMLYYEFAVGDVTSKTNSATLLD